MGGPVHPLDLLLLQELYGVPVGELGPVVSVDGDRHLLLQRQRIEANDGDAGPVGCGHHLGDSTGVCFDCHVDLIPLAPYPPRCRVSDPQLTRALHTEDPEVLLAPALHLRYKKLQVLHDAIVCALTVRYPRRLRAIQIRL